MNQMITKILSFEVKEVAPRVLEFVGSTEDKDREGDIILASGWQLKEFKKNPVFMWAHNYEDPPIGKAIKAWISEGKLKFHIQFADRDTYEFADTIYKLYKGGFLRATSVGFLPLESEPIEQKEGESGYHQSTKYIKQELLELSGVPVPANPNALAEAKAKGLIDDFSKFNIVEKPYPDEHSCRLRDPDDFQDGTFRRMEREHEGKKYSIIMGKLKGEDTMTEQAYRYSKTVWTASQARKHCSAHDGTFEAASEETIQEPIEIKSAISYQSAHPNGTPKAPEDSEWDVNREVSEAEVDDLKIMCAIVQGDPELKTSYKLPHHRAKGHSVIWKGVAAAGAVLMGARGGIDASEAEKNGAKAHLAKHYEEFDKQPPWKKAISQSTIADEIDYLVKIIQEQGLNEENLKMGWELVRYIMRLAGNDIPVDIAEKIGIALNKANRKRLEEIKSLSQAIIDSAKQEPDELSLIDIQNIVSNSVMTAIERVQGKSRR